MKDSEKAAIMHVCEAHSDAMSEQLSRAVAMTLVHAEDNPALGLLRAREWIVAALKDVDALPAILEFEIAQIIDADRNDAEMMPRHDKSHPVVRREVHAMTGGRCAYCDTEVSLLAEEGKVQMIVEHVVPESKGGPNCLHNYVPSCGSCNTIKRDNHVLQFIRRRIGERAA